MWRVLHMVGLSFHRGSLVVRCWCLSFSANGRVQLREEAKELVPRFPPTLHSMNKRTPWAVLQVHNLFACVVAVQKQQCICKKLYKRSCLANASQGFEAQLQVFPKSHEPRVFWLASFGYVECNLVVLGRCVLGQRTW